MSSIVDRNLQKLQQQSLRYLSESRHNTTQRIKQIVARDGWLGPSVVG